MTLAPVHGPVAVEFRAIGPYADPHNIRLAPGSTIEFGYFVVDPIEQLFRFQTSVSTDGPGEIIGATRGEWFSGGGTYDTVLNSTPGNPYRLAGHCVLNPLSLSGAGELARMTCHYDGPEPLTLDASLASSGFFHADGNQFLPVTGNTVVRITSDVGPATVELRAVGNYPDPHSIMIRSGQTVQLGYFVVDPIERLSGFETDLSAAGPGEFTGVSRGDWFSGGGAYDSVVASGNPGVPPSFFRLLGYCLQNPASLSGDGELARITFRYDGAATVTICANTGSTELVNADGRLFSPVSGNTTVTIMGYAGSATMELRAIGSYADPHNVRVGLGDTVQLGYFVIVPIEDLSGFQTDLSTSGSGVFVGVARGDWFSGHGSYDSVIASGTSGAPDFFYRVLGYCLQNPVSVSGVGELARITYQYAGPGVESVSAADGYAELIDEDGLPFTPVSGNVVVNISLHACDCYDINNDRKISFVDIAPFSASYGSSSGGPFYRAQYDRNHDGKITWLDIAPFSACYGASW